MNYIRRQFEKCPEILNLILFILGATVITFVTNNYFSMFAPFIISYVLTVMLRPFIVKIQSTTKMPNAPATIISLMLFISIASCVIWIFGHYIGEGVSYVIELLSSPKTMVNITNIVRTITDKTESITNFLKIEITTENIISVATDAVKNLVTALSTMSLNVVMGIPNFIIAFVIGCVAACYMLFDYERIYNAIIRQCSDGTRRIVHIFNTEVLTSLIKMIFSYVLISMICMAELLIGFYILGIKDASFVALLIALFDVLPVVGSGGILVPWGIILLLLGEPFKGIGLIVLWIVIVIVRQIVEPKIVGEQVGLYALTTVIALYLGLKLMGGIGLIVAPLYVIVCKKLNAEGVISLYKTKDLHDHKEEKDIIEKKD